LQEIVIFHILFESVFLGKKTKQINIICDAVIFLRYSDSSYFCICVSVCSYLLWFLP